MERVWRSTVAGACEQVAVALQLPDLFAGFLRLVVPSKPRSSVDEFFPYLYIIGRPNDFLLSMNMPALNFFAHLVVLIESLERIC